MKIAISCQSPLLQSSLSFFLKPYLASEDVCDFIITDDEQRQDSKPLCLILDKAYSHIRKPFSEQSLQVDIQAFYEKLQFSQKNDVNPHSALDSQSNEQNFHNIQDKSFTPPMSPPSYPKDSTNDALTKHIQKLCEESAKELSQKILALLKS